MNAERIKEIRKRAAASTRGPWEIANTYDGAWIRNEEYDVMFMSAPHQDDIEFIAHSREDIPALLAEVERLRTMVDEAMGYLSIGESRPANRYLAEALGVDENYHGYFGDDDDE